jgi:hypothetical protein
VPRANRYFLPSHIWHITHRCHKQDFLVKFAYDRRACRWVEEAVCRTSLARDFCWSESLAVGDESFVDGVKAGLGFKGRNRTVKKGEDCFDLRESEGDYTALPQKSPF